MIYNNDIIADLHTHSIFSLHAYSSIEENIRAARKRNLKYLAITDHFYGYLDPIMRKNEENRIKYMEERVSDYALNIIGGAEFNLFHEVPTSLQNLRWKPVGLHSWFCDRENISFDDVYIAFKNAYEKYHCNAFAHIERELHKVSLNTNMSEELRNKEINNLLDKLIVFAHDNNIPLELNESSIISDEGGGIARINYWIKRARDIGAIITLGSDAHFSGEIGVFDNCIKILNTVDYPKELVLNTNENLLKEYLN